MQNKELRKKEKETNDINGQLNKLQKEHKTIAAVAMTDASSKFATMELGVQAARERADDLIRKR